MGKRTRPPGRAIAKTVRGSRKEKTASGDSPRPIGDILRSAFADIKDRCGREHRIVGLPTGLDGLDELLGGFRRTRFVVVAGEPSIGKTSFAMRVVEEIGLRRERPVLFFTPGNSSSEIAQRMLGSYCRIDLNRLRRGAIGREEFQKLVAGSKSFNESPIYLEDTPLLSLPELRDRSIRMKEERRVEFLVIDDYESMDAPEAETGSALKRLAEDLDSVVLLMVGTRQGRRPRLADITPRETVRAADAVLLLHRDEYYDPDTDRRGIADVEIAWNRSGPTAVLELAFTKQFARFETLGVRSPVPCVSSS